MNQSRRYLSQGLTMIEILIVVAIFAILTVTVLGAIKISRDKAHDNAIRNDIRQLRWLAEQVYDSQAASYRNWASGGTVPRQELVDQITQLQNDIEEQLADTDESTLRSVLRDSQTKDYCASAPLKTDPNQHYCIDTTGVFQTVNAPCPDTPTGGAPLRCANI